MPPSASVSKRSIPMNCAPAHWTSPCRRSRSADCFFHLNQRRGFKSNRKTDRGNSDETGKIAIGVDRLRTEIRAADARTFGEYLFKRRAKASDANTIPSVRARLRPETGRGPRATAMTFIPVVTLSKPNSMRSGTRNGPIIKT